MILSAYDAFVVPNYKSESFITQILNRKKLFLRLPNTVNEDFFKTTEIRVLGRRQTVPDL